MSCSNQPEDATPSAPKEETLMPRKRKIKDGTCMKCKTQRGVFSRMGFVYCRPCFDTQLHTRITRGVNQPLAQAGPHTTASQPNTLRPGTQAGDVVIGVSGGAGSAALLDMLVREAYIGARRADDVDEGVRELKLEEGSKQGKAEVSHPSRRGGSSKGTLAPKKTAVWETAWVVHVDFRGLISQLPDTEGEIRERCRTRYREASIQVLDLRIEDAYDPALVERIRGRASGPSGWQRNPDDLAKLQRLLASMSSSSHPHILQTLLSSLLATACTALSLAPDGRPISHLLLGETSTRQAQRIISSTALGGGWGLPLELAPAVRLADMGDVQRIKPLRDTMAREVAYYCHLRGLGTFAPNGWDAVGAPQGGAGAARGKSGARSLERLTEDFINGLMSTHPSTVSTITRTGSKLQFRGGEGVPTHACPLCGLPSEPSTAAWKARTALTSLKPADRPAEAITNGHATAGSEDDRLIEGLCYACLTTLDPMLKAMGSGEQTRDLPPWVARRLGRPDGLSLDEEEAGEAEASGHLAGSHGGGHIMGQAEMASVVREFLIDE